jgi:hypothetical protein
MQQGLVDRSSGRRAKLLAHDKQVVHGRNDGRNPVGPKNEALRHPVDPEEADARHEFFFAGPSLAFAARKIPAPDVRELRARINREPSSPRRFFQERGKHEVISTIPSLDQQIALILTLPHPINLRVEDRQIKMPNERAHLQLSLENEIARTEEIDVEADRQRSESFGSGANSKPK